MKFILPSIFILFNFYLSGQNACNFIKDTLYLPQESKFVNTQYVQADLKNNSVIQLYITETNKYYLKVTVKENLYFDRVDMLEIRSGAKSFWAKDTKQFKLDKHTGFYIVELYKNYAATLKEEGITGITFNKAETKFSKQDKNMVKQISQCFYDAISNKK